MDLKRELAHVGEVSTDRVIMLTDGIFAIVMTILVLELHVPELLSSAQLGHALIEEIPVLISFFVSFIILGLYWIGHHNFFHLIKRVDRPMLWINILFLFFISLIPFSASVLGKYGNEPVAVALYGAHLVVIGAILLLGWTYATRHHHLVDPKMSHALINGVSKYIAIAPIIYLVAVLFALVNPTISMVIYFLVPIYYIFPTRVDSLFSGRQEHIHSDDHDHKE